MTDEARGDTPEEAPAPPTSTRWSEDAVAEDATPAPPFVPGRREAGPMEAEAPPQEAGGFPFDLAVEEAEQTPAETAADDDFPFEQFDIEGRGEAAAASPEPTGTSPEPAGAPPEPTGLAEPAGWTPGELAGAEPESSESSAADAIPAPEDAPATQAMQAEEVGASSEVEDVAALLDRMARLLRTEGAAGVRRELDSPDRLTAVLAGILAGYISGRS